MASASSNVETWYRGHLPPLDALRGIAILLVLVAHSPMARVLPFTWCGVDLFFVLSGFLITGILLDTERGDCYFFNFYARRCLRIWPAYYLLVVLALGVLPLFGEPYLVARPGELWPWYLCFGQNFAPRAATVLLVTWSVAVEEQFYLVWPLLVYFLPRRFLLWLAVGIVLVSPGLRYALLHQGVPAVDVFRSCFTRADGFAAGAVVALWLRLGVVPQTLARHCARILAGAMVVCAVCLPLALKQPETSERPALFALGFSGLAVGFAAVLGLAISARPVTRWLDSRLLRRIGTISYGLYLYHGMVFLVGRNGTGATWMSSPWLLWTLRFGAVFVIAELSYRYFEQPFLRLKRHFEYRERGAEIEAPTVSSGEAPMDPARLRRIASKDSW